MRIMFLLLLLLTLSCAKSEKKQFLKTDGHDIVNVDGEKVLLRSVGLGNWLLPEGYMWKFGKDGDRPRKIEKLIVSLIGVEKAEKFWKQFRKHYITESDIKRISELGFNSVRPALNARLFMTEGDSTGFIEENFELLDDLITWCRKYDIYVILDMHGAPGGQTGANIDDSPNDQPELFIDEKNQDKLHRLWVHIANRYANEPVVAAYDLLNEPLPGSTGAAKKYGHLVEPLYKRLTKAIRKVDKNHMITIEGIDWANDWSIFGKPFDDNLIYQFHYYCWNRPDNLNDISQYIKHREKLNAPVWVGETGEKGNTIYWATTQYFEANNIGWSFWPWKKMDTQNTPYSIKRPKNWQKIAEYSRGKAKPDSALAQNALDELIENIKLVNCEFYPDVVNSIFRRVPVKIEAENYGHDGLNKSYFVADTSIYAKYYRTSEPLAVELIDFKNNEFLSEQYIVLHPDEWVRYTFKSNALKKAQSVLRLRKDAQDAYFNLVINEQSQSFQVEDDGWQEIVVSDIDLNTQNEMYFKVQKGTLHLDWIEINKP